MIDTFIKTKEHPIPPQAPEGYKWVPVMKLVDILVYTKMAKSKTEARNLIRQGAVTVYPVKEKSCDQSA